MESSLIEEEFARLDLGEQLFSLAHKRAELGVQLRVRQSRDESPPSAKQQQQSANLFSLTIAVAHEGQHDSTHQGRPSLSIFSLEQHRIRQKKEVGLSRRFCKLLKRLKVSKTSQDCSVCQQHFLRDQLIVQLPCKHIFHKNGCLSEWLRISVFCPICKLNLEDHFRQQERQADEKPTND